MQETTHKMVNHHFNFIQSIFNFLIGCINFFTYVVSPEDTTPSLDEKTDSHRAGGFKIVFWIAVSICLAVFLGQLN